MKVQAQSLVIALIAHTASAAANATLLWTKRYPEVSNLKALDFAAAAIAVHDGAPATFVVACANTIDMYNETSPTANAAWTWTPNSTTPYAVTARMAQHAVGTAANPIDTIVFGAWGEEVDAALGCFLLGWSTLQATPSWILNDTWDETGGCDPFGADISDDGSTVALYYAAGKDFSTDIPVLRVFDAQTGAERWRHTGTRAENGAIGVSVSATGAFVAVTATLYATLACSTYVYEGATGSLRGTIPACGNAAFQLSASGDTVVVGNTVYTWSAAASAYALQHTLSLRGLPAAVALDRSAPDGEGIVALYCTWANESVYGPIMSAELNLASLANGSVLSSHFLGIAANGQEVMFSPAGLAVAGNLAGVVATMNSTFNVPRPPWNNTLAAVYRAGTQEPVFDFIGENRTTVQGTRYMSAAALAVEPGGAVLFSVTGIEDVMFKGPSTAYTWRLTGVGSDVSGVPV